ncbi:hypothetical protein [Paenibacillus hamazuiensis]|uniref:hypothetical protein n=1 Tax=Paenibacillus hamazuiensis TaxID=2936508 RepID=UPI00200EE46E|nr:hypothetical protein [Paenibacillus hamazuiensis]
MEPGASSLMFIKVAFSFTVMFIVLPSLVTRFKEEDDTILDRLFIPLIHSTLFIIIAVHLLVVLKLFETLSLIAVCVAGFVYFWRRKFGVARIDYGTRVVTEIFDVSEDVPGSMRQTRLWFGQLWNNSKALMQHMIRRIRKYPLAAALIAVTLGYAAYVRFHHAFAHLYFAASDPYIHAKWAKSLLKNTLYVDGVYPQGYPAVLSAISGFFMIDLYGIVRFIGPIAGILIVLSVGHSVRKFGANPYGVFIAMFVYTGFAALPSYVWRQLSALPMEYAAVFVLPGLVYWVLFCRYGSKHHLLLAAECLLLTLLMHPFSTACLGVAMAVAGVIYAYRIWRRRQLWTVFAYLAGAGAIGLLPIGIGRLLGIPFYASSFDYVVNSVQAGEKSPSFSRLWSDFAAGPNGVILLSAAFAALLATGVYIIRRGRLKQRETGLPVFILINVLFFMMYKAKEIGLPMLVPPDRMGVFFSLLAANLCGLALLALDRLMDAGTYKRYIIAAAAMLFAGFIVMTGQTVKVPIGYRYQYDESVQAYLHIKNEFEAGNWTIVSPVEEYPLVEAFGYHTNLWEFVQNISPGSKEKVGFPTAHVFFFVETKPLVGGKEIAPSDATKPFPGPVEGDLADFYYRSNNRVILEAKLNNWVQWYMKRYPDKMSVYYDSPQFKVYHLRQSAGTPPAELPKLPEEEVGVW